MARFLRREKEIQWLNKSSNISQIVVVSGLKGTGKTVLTKLWLAEGKKSAKWYSLSRFSSVSELLGYEGKSLESALELSSGKWNDFDIIIWDDFHNLSFQSQQTLLQVLKHNSNLLTLHLILSDERLDAGMDVPSLNLSGFDESQCDEYLKQVGLSVSDKEIQKIHKMTGGLPFLLQLWIQDPAKIKRGGIVADDFSPEVVEILRCFSFFRSSFTQEDVLKITSKLDVLAEMKKKMLIEAENKDYKIVPFLKDLIQESLTEAERLSYAKKSVEILDQKKDVSHFEKFISALHAKNQNIIESHYSFVNLTMFEGMNPKDLEEILSWIECEIQNLSYGATRFIQRLKLHLLILQGRRVEALDFAKSQVKSFSEEELKEDDQWLAYEIVHWLNRSNNSKDVEQRLAIWTNQSKVPLKYFFRMEQAMSHVSSDPERAREGLLRVLKDIEVSKEGNEKILLLKAQILFQIAISYNHQQKYEDALNYFFQAEKVYKEIDRFYFALFCLFNSAWIYFFKKDFKNLEKLLIQVREQSTRFGYRYLQAGVEWLDSQMAFLNCENSKALDRIQSSLSKMEQSATQQARVDALITKARILVDMGLSQRAKAIMEEFDKIYGKDLPPRIKLLEYQLQFQFCNVEEFRDKWHELGGQDDDEFYGIYLLQRGHEIDIKGLNLTLRGQMALKENELIKVIKSGVEEDIWATLTSFEAFLGQISDPRFERLALYCLKLENSPDEMRASILESAELEFDRLSADPHSKIFFETWLDAIKKKKSITEMSAWKKIKESDKERWHNWIRAKATELSHYTLSTLEGRKSVNEVIAPFPSKSLVLIEDLGQVYFKQKRIEDFNRKPVLRQLLALILEVFPHHLSKGSLASALWGESYNPQIHDPRIYTSIQRLRTLISEKAIENWESGYRWNPEKEFYYYRSNKVEELGSHRIKTLILEALQKRKGSLNPWVTRADLVEATESSDATVKRILSQLLTEGLIERKGKGPAVVYALRKKSI